MTSCEFSQTSNASPEAPQPPEMELGDKLRFAVGFASVAVAGLSPVYYFLNEPHI